MTTPCEPITPHKRGGLWPLIGFAVSIAGCLAALVWIVHEWRQSLDARPALVPTPSIVDFGPVPQGRYQAEVTLSNISNIGVTIHEVRASCNCSEVLLPAGDVVPEASVALTCKWDTRALRGDATTQILVVYERQDCPAEKRAATILLKGYILPDFQFSPERLLFARGKDTTALVRFEPDRLKTMRVTSALCTHPAFSCSMENDQTVRVAFDSNLWLGERGAIHLVVQTNSENEPTVRIPVTVSARIATRTSGE